MSELIPKERMVLQTLWDMGKPPDPDELRRKTGLSESEYKTAVQGLLDQGLVGHFHMMDGRQPGQAAGTWVTLTLRGSAIIS